MRGWVAVLLLSGCAPPPADPVPGRIDPWADRGMPDAAVDAAIADAAVVDAAPRPDPMPAPEPAPQPDPMPAPEPAPQPDPMPAPEPAPQPDPMPAPEPAPQPDPMPEPEPQGVWSPAPGTSWQWQLTERIDTSLDVAMYDVDLFDTPEQTIQALQADGKAVVCYFSAGSHEDWRSDADQFPREAIGNPLGGWPGERWIDVRNAQIRRVMQARLDLAAQKGCDAVEPDNTDGYENNDGLGLRSQDALDYLRWLAAEAHARDLSIGMKNSLDHVEALVDLFDWALNEECMQWNECHRLNAFIQAGKAVFHVEYGGANLAGRVCPQANAMNFDTLIKTYDLDAWRVACR
jgi:endo-alpha-1,4-polygalactosaminidase (GH114 family)